jgi:uncharacterized protein (DUF488 family)
MSNLVAVKKNLVLTFGYGNRKDYDVFLNYLEEFNVSCVVDVRLSPRAWTRKWYGDSIKQLCISKSICYMSKPSLGNISGCSHWVPPHQQEAEQTLLEVSKILETGNVLLLCAEMDSSKCHRVEIACKLQEIAKGSVTHLK